MSGCEGCYIGPKGMNQQLEQIRQEAKAYALKNNFTVAIYKEGFEYYYGKAEDIIAGGLTVLEFVSGNN